MPAIHGFLAVVKSLAGRCSEAADHGEQSIACARESDAAGRVLAYTFSAYAAAYGGERELALARARKGVEISEPISARNIRGIALNGLGLAHLVNEQWADACEVQTRVWNDGITTQKMWSFRARALFEAESADAAIAAGEGHIAYTQHMGGRAFECEARLDLAAVLVRLPSPPRERIEHELERAAELIDQTGAHALRPLIHEVRAILDPSTRERELRDALHLYAEMGSAHAGRIETELAR
jgi:hypothetical protein